MKVNTPQIRQSMVCPYEGPPSAELRAFGAVAKAPPGYDGPPLTVCPGYTTSLPETIELARAWAWSEKGELRTYCDGQPSEAVIDGVDIFAAAVAELRDWNCPTCAQERK
jgi:hypothetical protein